jgi:copper chaperone
LRRLRQGRHPGRYVGAGTAPLSVDLKSGEMRLPAGADVPAITRAIQRAGFGVAP